MTAPANRLPPQRPPTIEEFKAIACGNCGCTWRRQVVGNRLMQHRFNVNMKAPAQTLWALCLQCGAQLDGNGKPVAPEHEDYMPAIFRKEIDLA